MNKICTSIDQSKKLIELGIDVNTADMWYQYIGDSFKDGITKPLYFPMIMRDDPTEKDIPAWSVPTLLGLMPRIEHLKPFIDLGPKLDSEGVSIYYHSEDSPYIERDNLIDAAFDMICWLLENKKI